MKKGVECILRFYLMSNPFRCNGIWDKENDDHVSPEKIIMMVNRLYELDKKFVLKVLECNEDECFLCEYDDLCIRDYYNDSEKEEDSSTNEPFIIEENDGKRIYSINPELTEEEFMEAYLDGFDKAISFKDF